MRYSGKIEQLDHIIISDPSYDEKVTCRYEKKGLNKENWLVDIDIKPDIDEVKDFVLKGTEFFLFLYEDKQFCELRNNGIINYLPEINIEKTKIGVDTACVALGINEKAKEIIELRDEWQPKCALHTLSDGIFGEVKEGTIEGDIVFICLSGYLSGDTGYSVEDIFDYLKSQLEIKNIKYEYTETLLSKREQILNEIKETVHSFKELIKDNNQLSEYLKKYNLNNESITLRQANAILCNIQTRNEMKISENLKCEFEKSPFTNKEKKLIKNYAKLELKYLNVEDKINEEYDSKDIDI